MRAARWIVAVVRTVFVGAAVSVLAFAAALGWMQDRPVDQQPPPPSGPASPSSSSTTAARAQALMTQHRCWSGHAPADVEVPGHVVVIRENGKVVYGGPRLVKQALGEVFTGEDHGLQVAGFCR